MPPLPSAPGAAAPPTAAPAAAPPAAAALKATPADERAALLGRLRGAYQRERTAILERFSATAADDPSAGLACQRALAQATDHLLAAIWQAVCDRHPALVTQQAALIACGGYGRGEVAPCSDIDVMILTPERVPGALRTAIEAVLYLLWDVGLTIGHAVRSLSQARDQARRDQTILTALLECRLLAGPLGPYEELVAMIERRLRRGRAAAYFAQKQAEMAERHRSGGDGRTRVEPDIKSGRGGLRDLHMLGWLARFILPGHGVVDLAATGLLSPPEITMERQARAMLARVRCALHLAKGRDDNRLGFEVQREVAALLGYADAPPPADRTSPPPPAGEPSAVERFMRDTLLAMRQVNALVRVVGATLRLRAGVMATPEARGIESLSAELPAGFQIRERRLAFAAGVDLGTQPLMVLSLFQLIQARGLEPHPDALRDLEGIGPVLAGLAEREPEAGRRLLALLTARGPNPEPVLRLMAETGVLGQLLPEFTNIIGLMQFDLYHYYTVDEHTLHALGLLHGWERDPGTAPDAVTDLVGQIADRSVLYLALLLHDIAKGRDGDHSQLGEQVALAVAPRLGLDADATAAVAWLVRHHLLMSATVERRDLQDPATIRRFADQVGSAEQLALLTVLTCVDVSAVGPGRLTAWKGQLLRQLYRATMAWFGGAEASMIPAQITLERQRATAALLPHWDPLQFASYAALGSNGFWMAFSPRDHARLARLVARAEQDHAPLVIDLADREDELATDVAIYVADHPRLFAGLTGALSASGVDIIRAKVFTLGNGMALDVFSVQDSGGPVTDRERRARIVVLIRQLLQGDVALETVLARFRPHISARRRAFAVTPRVRIDNTVSRGWTVIEVTAKDQPGLLHAIARVLADQNLNVGLAKVNTFGERAVDAFYVRTMLGMKLDEARVEAVQGALLQRLADHGRR